MLARPVFARVQVRQNLVSRLRLLRQHQLQVMAERGLDCRRRSRSGTRIWSASDPSTMLRLLSAASGAGAEAFVRSLQLLEHVQAGTLLGLLLQQLRPVPGGALPVPPGSRATAAAAVQPCRAAFAH